MHVAAGEAHSGIAATLGVLLLLLRGETLCSACVSVCLSVCLWTRMADISYLLQSHATAADAIAFLRSKQDVFLTLAAPLAGGGGGRAEEQQTSQLLLSARDVNDRQHALQTLYLLHAQTQQWHPSVAGAFLAEALRFVQVCLPEEMQLTPAEFVGVVHRMTDVASDICRVMDDDRGPQDQQAECMAQVMETIQAVMLAADKLTGGVPERLTPLHADALQLCLLAKMYRLGAQFVDGRCVMEVKPKTTALKPKDLLRYFYYAGMIMIGVGRMDAATTLFVRGITTPANVLSEIVVESWKKAVLVSLIDTGDLFEMPRYAPNIVTQLHRQGLAPYDALVNAFLQDDAQALHRVVNKERDRFRADHNYGLAKRCVQALAEHRVRKLTNTYLTLSLSDIASVAMLNDAGEAERYILQLVARGVISATIDQESQMVTFQDQDTHETAGAGEFGSTAMEARLQEHMLETFAIGERIRKLQSEILTDPKYINSTIKQSKGTGPALPGKRGWMGDPYDDLGGGGRFDSMG